MATERNKSAPPDPAAAQLGQDLIAQLTNDFAVHKGAKLGQDLIAQLQHDFGDKKKADDAAQAKAFAEALLGKVARDFGSVRPGPMPDAPMAAIPVARATPSTLAPPPSEELAKAEADLARAAEAPLAADEADEVAAMQGGGAFGFIKKLLGR